MRGGPSSRASAASSEQADALLFAAAAAGGGAGTGRPGRGAAAAAAAPWQQQKLRYAGDSANAASSASRIAPGGETSLAVAVLGLLFCLSVCGCIFFIFLSLLFLYALDTLSLPLATKHAAGRACLAAALLHLASLAVFGSLLHQPHPDESLRRMRAFVWDLGKRGGRAVLKNGGYLLIRGTRAARDYWLRIAHTDATAGAGSTGSSGLRSRHSSGTAAGAALAGGATHLPYCSRDGAANSSSGGRPPSLASAAETRCYDATRNTKTKFAHGYLQQEQAAKLGSHHAASYAPLTSSSPSGTTAGRGSYGWNIRTSSPSLSSSWKGLHTSSKSAAAAAHQRGDDAGGDRIGKTPSVTSGNRSEHSTRTWESSLDFAAGSRQSGHAAEPAAHTAVTNSPCGNLLLLGSPSPSCSHVSATNIPPVLGLTPALSVGTAAAAGRPAGAPVSLVQPAAACVTLPAAAGNDAWGHRGTGVEERRPVNEVEGKSSVCYRLGDNSSSNPYDVMRMQGAAGIPAAFSSSAASRVNNSCSPRSTGPGDCSSGGMEALWSSKCGGTPFQQLQVSFLPPEAKPEKQQQQQAVQQLFQHSSAQGEEVLQQEQAQGRFQQLQQAAQQQQAQQMLQHQQALRQQQHVQMQFSHLGLPTFQQNSYVGRPSTGQGQSASTGLLVPGAAAAHTSNSSCLPAGEEIFAASGRNLATQFFVRESQRPFHAMPR